MNFKVYDILWGSDRLNKTVKEVSFKHFFGGVRDANTRWELANYLEKNYGERPLDFKFQRVLY